MVYLMINWALSALGLLAVAAVAPGSRILEIESVVIAAGAVGLISAGLGTVLRHAPGTVAQAMSAVFLMIIDALLFRLSALLLPGFHMLGFEPAIAGGLVLLALNMALPRLARMWQAGLESEPLAGRQRHGPA
jgi:putative membrane protein